MKFSKFLKPTFLFCLVVIVLCGIFIANTLPNSPYPALVPFVWPIFIIISLIALGLATIL